MLYHNSKVLTHASICHFKFKATWGTLASCKECQQGDAVDTEGTPGRCCREQLPYNACSYLTSSFIRQNREQTAHWWDSQMVLIWEILWILGISGKRYKRTWRRNNNEPWLWKCKAMCLSIKKEIFNISIEGRKLEVNVESDIKLDNGVRFKNSPFEKYSREVSTVFLHSHRSLKAEFNVLPVCSLIPNVSCCFSKC